MKKQILVSDDDELMREATCEILKASGSEVLDSVKYCKLFARSSTRPMNNGATSHNPAASGTRTKNKNGK